MKKLFLEHKSLIFVLLGLANALPFTFDGLWLVSWFGLTPFFYLLSVFEKSGATVKTLTAYIFCFFFSFHFGVYHFFMALVPMSFVGMGYFSSIVVLLAGWCILSALHSALFTLAYYPIVKFCKSETLRTVYFGLVFVLVQYLLSLGTYGFTWARISLPQSALLPLIQSASLLGPYFVDLILISVNVLLTLALLTKKISVFVGLAVAVFGANYLFGFVHMQDEFDVTAEKKVSIIQGNVLTDQKWNSKSSYSVYLSQSLLLDETDSLVIWPETAIPTDLNDSTKIINELKAYTVSSGNEILVGAFYRSNVGRELNGAYYFSNGEMSDNIYFKRRLVPFGEFLPFRKILRALPYLDSINLLSTDLHPGYSTYIHKTRQGNVGTLICFDSIFPYLARESVKDGAQLLAIMTNDSWYKDFPAVYQHNNQAKWRAVENGRYVVRAANSGVSSVITPHGETVASLPPLERSVITERVSFISENTLYTKVGDVIIYFILAVLLLFGYTNKQLPYFQRKLLKSNISSDSLDS